MNPTIKTIDMQVAMRQTIAYQGNTAYFLKREDNSARGILVY